MLVLLWLYILLVFSYMYEVVIVVFSIVDIKSWEREKFYTTTLGSGMDIRSDYDFLSDTKTKKTNCQIVKIDAGLFWFFFGQVESLLKNTKNVKLNISKFINSFKEQDKDL